MTSKNQEKQTYQSHPTAVHIVLYDLTGTALDPNARKEFESLATQVSQLYPNLAINVEEG